MIKPIQLSGFLLLLGGLAFVVQYGFIICVAMVANGAELMTRPDAWYAALAPILYSTFCVLTVFIAQSIKIQKLLVIGLIFGGFAVPSFFVSFLSFGKYLPILMVLWAVFYGLLYTPSSRLLSLKHHQR